MEDEVGQGSVGAGEEVHRRIIAGAGQAAEQSGLRESDSAGARGNRGTEPGRAAREAVTLPLARPGLARLPSQALTAFRTPSRAADTSSRSRGPGSACQRRRTPGLCGLV